MGELHKIALKLSEASQFGVVSAFNDDPETDNFQAHEQLVQEVKNLGYNPETFDGEWEGAKELSIVIPGVEISILVNLGEKYGQDAVAYYNGSEIETIEL